MFVHCGRSCLEVTAVAPIRAATGTGAASLFIDGLLKQSLSFQSTAAYAGFFNSIGVATHKSEGRKPVQGVIDDLVSVFSLVPHNKCLCSR